MAVEVFESTGSPIVNHPDQGGNSAMENALRAYVLGETPDGVPSHEQAYGLSIGMDGINQPPDPNAQPPASLEEQAAQLEQLSPDRLMALQGQLDALKSQLGTAENEKGVLRKRTEEATAALNDALLQQRLMAAKFEEMLNQPAQPQYQQPQYGYGAPPAPYGQPQYGYQAPPDPFGNIKDEELMYGAQVKQMMQETVGPAIFGAYQRADAAARVAQELQSQLLGEKKRQAGISQRDEQMILMEQPWIKSLPNEAARTDALIGFQRVRSAAQPVAQPQPTAAPSQAPVAAAVRRLTATGPQGQPSGTAEAHATSSPMDAIMAEWQETLKIPLGTGRRDAAQRAILTKAGIRAVNDWRT